MHHAAKPASIRTNTPSRSGLTYTGPALAALLILAPAAALAQDVSNPATLQIFEARWDTIEDRAVDMFYAGYGAIWLPPPSRADSGDQSVGYDVYDRFDLGDENRATGYGTKTGLQTTIQQAHNAGIDVYTDLILNHNGFTELGQTDGGGNSFEDAGGYPGFAITLPSDIDGDFHGAFESGDINGRLSNLVDIAQEKTGPNYQFIRHPVDPSNPDNIPAGTTPAFGRIANVPTPTNAQFYPDQGIPGTQIDVDPGPGVSLVTRYNFNTANPMAGDPTIETAEDLLMRNVQWMVQVVGVDGFRIDAVKHFPASTLERLDEAVFGLGRTQHDGSTQPVFSFSEVLDGNKAFLQSRIERNLPNNNAIDTLDNQVQGNRDALDFPLFFALRNNLTGNGLGNNWHGIRNASQDTEDDGLRNGSQGVSFVNSHDNLAGGFPFLENVAYAYTLMRPGDAVVYHNAKEFGGGRDFPNDGRDDALGGFSSDTLTTLLDIRNTHGRGSFNERWIDDAFNPNGFSNVYIYERGNSAIVGLNSRVDAFVETRNGVQTEFAPGTRLVELTGNADDPAVDPGDAIPNTITVDGAGQVNISIPSNSTHGKGYVIYGLPRPDASMTLTNVDSVITGAGAVSTSATAVVNDVDVITADTFTLRIDTSPVTLSDGFRDIDADGDFAAFKIDEGYDANGNGGVDFVTPGSVTYGFENFLTTNTPGYINDGLGANIGSGTGVYEQTIDTTQLAEGYHFITGRTFRHRDDGGPAIFDDQRRAIYIDRLPPDSAVDTFELNGSGTGNMDLLMRSVDKTAQAVFVYLDLPANATEAEILDVDPGLNTTQKIDRDLFRRSYLNVRDGNHVVTLLTIESTGRINIQRFAGINTDGANGAGIGDLNSDDAFSPDDFTLVPGGFEDILYSQNDKFHAAADANADGLVDNRDLFLLESVLTNADADPATLLALTGVLNRRADVNEDTFTNAADIDILYTQFGSSDWLYDLDVSGNTDDDDIATLVQDLLRTSFGDLDLDGTVSYADRNTLEANLGLTGLGWAGGDLDGSGLIDQDDLNLLLANLLAGDLDGDGFVGINDLNIVLANWNQNVPPANPLADPSADGFVGIDDLNEVLGNWNAGTPPNIQTNIPEPTTLALVGCLAVLGTRRPSRRRIAS